MSFVHLHVHTEYSLSEGGCKIDNLIYFAKNLGQSALAITDSSNLFGAVKFFFTCYQEKIKPILGCELLVKNENFNYEVNQNFQKPFFKLIILSENLIGYENLVKLVSISCCKNENDYYPLNKTILKKYSEGLIALSNNIDGEIGFNFFNFGYQAAKQTVVNYCEIFGKENFFLELQNHGFAHEDRLNSCFIKIAKELQINLVATNNVHYVKKTDYKIQNLLQKIQGSANLTNNVDKNSNQILNNEFYLKSELEMKKIFSSCSDAVKNTQKIADRCYFNFEFGKINIQFFNNKQNVNKILWEKAKEGLFLKFGKKISKELINRFIYEFNVVVKMNFASYFLIVSDYVNFAKKNNITTGVGRGSSVGSLLAFCLNITEIDPLEFDLSFDRFLNLNRKTLPDFDVDFCNEGRNKVVNYVKKKYGEQNVAKIITFGTLAARAALREVAKLFQLDNSLLNQMFKLIPNNTQNKLNDLIENSPKLKKLIYNNEKLKIVFKSACLVEGYIKNISIHACAITIAPNSLNKTIPLIKHNGVILTQYSADDLFKLGFLKFDFLGLKTLTLMSKCEQLIKKYYSNFELNKINLNDRKTFQLLSYGETKGIFQFESKLMSEILTKIKPTTINHLMAAMALGRPGTLNQVDKFVKNKNNVNSIKWFNSNIKLILKSTYGVVIYQEQIIKLFQKIAGYSISRTDLIRTAVSKKNFELINKEKPIFLFGLTNKNGEVESVGAVNLGFNETIAEKIFNKLVQFASYTFNKSHAAAYSIISYRMAFLKANFGIFYMNCLLNSMVDNDIKLKIYMNECEKMKIKIKPVNVNRSGVYFTIVSKNEIEFSLIAIKGVGKLLAEQIVQEQLKNRFLSIQNFLDRINFKNLTRIAFKALFESGAFNEILTDHISNYESLDKLYFRTQNLKKNETEGQLSLF